MNPPPTHKTFFHLNTTTMNERQIKKIKLTDKNTLDVEYSEITGEEGTADIVTRQGSHEVHIDFINKLNELNIHLATLCEEGQYTEFEDDKTKLEIFSVTGLSFGGSDEHEGVTLIGRKLLKNNGVLNLVPPFVKLNPAHSTYSYVASLNEIARELQSEADLHLNGKYAPPRQMNLFDKGPSEDGEIEEEVEKPKGRHRKLKKESEAA